MGHVRSFKKKKKLHEHSVLLILIVSRASVTTDPSQASARCRCHALVDWVSGIIAKVANSISRNILVGATSASK